MQSKYSTIKSYLNSDGQITQWASKKHRQKQLLMLAYIAAHFEASKTYTEPEVNAIIKQWHTFGDHALLRRELIDARLMTRDVEGRCYSLVISSDVVE